jgi:gamma-glutamylcyclotransferase (GGCT)/AIG2-like uncharacterized protein YtfP
MRNLNKRIYYFAYGSNLNLIQMKQRCPGHRIIKNYLLNGFRLVFRSVADIEKDSKNNVQGVIFMLSDNDEKKLDVYEGFPNLYRKEYFNCFIGGSEEKILYYKMNYKGVGKPSDKYYNAIRQGYKDNNLDVDFLTEALDYSLKNFREPVFYSKRWED